ncbi:unnamed protein product, partial [Anisakis simplex]|uniref:G_PROTEIN_RECEP_F1_2 domain-containing protein n=1 Tax=Anisakis simplex TaxID=6269 RepID=A0A0M3KC60_ANISI
FQKQFEAICRLIITILFAISFGAYFVIFVKKVFMRKRRRQHPVARDIEWIVHTIRSDPDSEDSSEVIPHQPSVAPYFVSRELHFTIICFITLLFYGIHQWTANEEHFCLSTGVKNASTLTSLALPILLLVYWTLPHLYRHLLFHSANSPKLAKLFKFIRSLTILSAICPCARSRVAEGPATIQMDGPRFSLQTTRNGIPYRVRQDRSRSEDLGSTRVRIATIFMNNER